MKYIVFWAFFGLGVPSLAVMGIMSAKVRGLLLTGLVFVTMLDSRVSINLMSMEMYRGPDRGFEITLADLLAIALTIALLIRSGSKIKFWPFNTTWMMMFFILAVSSAAAAPVPIYGAFSIWKMIRMYMLFWCVANAIHSGVDINYLWYGLLAVGLAMFLLTFKQKYMDGYYRVPGPFDHSNTIPPYANLMMPALLMYGLVEKNGPQWRALLFLVAGLGLVFAVLATQSRAGLVLSGGSVLAVLFMALVRARSGRVTLISLVVLLGMVAGGIKAADTIIYRFLHAPEASGQARDEFNHAAKLMADGNTFGVGLNNFSWVLTYTPAYNSHIETMASEKEAAGVAHHIYWLTAAELGYPGLILFSIIMIRFTWLALRWGFRGRSKESLLLFGLFMGWMCLNTQGFLEWAFRITPVTNMFAIIAGTTVGTAAIEKANRKAAKTDRSGPDEEQGPPLPAIGPAPRIRARAA